MTEALTVRVSALPRYFDCPRSNVIRFIRKEIADEGHELAEYVPSVKAAIGTGVHAMMGELFKQKMAFGQMDLDAAFAAREAAFDAELAKGALWDTTTPHVDAAKKQLQALCRAFLPVAERVQPVAVEDELEWLISPLGSEAVPIRLIGHRDVKDNRNEIHDHKTGSEFPACHAQLGGYAILSLYREEEVSAVRVNYAPTLPVSKLHETKVRSVRFDLDECMKTAWRTLREIQRQYMEWLETKDPRAFPPNPYSQSCTAKYCAAYGTPWCKVGCCE